MKVSGKQKFTLYFRPDCEFIEKSTSSDGSQDGLIQDNLVTTSGGEDSVGLYKIHLINVDRQKDDSLEVRIDDFRGVDIFAQE